MDVRSSSMGRTRATKTRFSRTSKATSGRRRSTQHFPSKTSLVRTSASTLRTGSGKSCCAWILPLPDGSGRGHRHSYPRLIDLGERRSHHGQLLVAEVCCEMALDGR